MKFAFPRLLLFSFILAACSGKAIEHDGGDLTRAEVESLSRGMQQSIEKAYPLLRHKVVNRYVDNLGQSLVSHNPEMPPLPYEFRVLKSNDIGVFSLPGGIVYLTLGTLRACEVEGELAGALAHELAHQQLNHPLLVWRKRVNSSRAKKISFDFEGNFQGVFLGPNGALTYPEGMEQEADQLAPIVLYRAKFDPRAYAGYLEILKKINTLEPQRSAIITLSHPLISKRIDWVKEELAKIPPLKDPTLSTQSFEEIKQMLKTAELRGKKSNGGIGE